LPGHEPERRDQLLLLLLFGFKFLIQGHSYILGLCQIIILSSNIVTSRAISVCHHQKIFQLVTQNRNVLLKQVGRSCKNKLQYVPASIEVPRDYRVLLANVIGNIPKGMSYSERCLVYAASFHLQRSIHLAWLAHGTRLGVLFTISIPNISAHLKISAVYGGSIKVRITAVLFH